MMMDDDYDHIDENRKSKTNKFLSNILIIIFVLGVLILLLCMCNKNQNKKIKKTKHEQEREREREKELERELELENKHKSEKEIFVPVVIIGGGITGLLVAYQLQKQKIPFILLEDNPQVGGRVATIKYADGTTSEAPLEEYWEKSPIIPILKELNIELHQDNAHSSTLIDNKIISSHGDPDCCKYFRNFIHNQHNRPADSQEDQIDQLDQDNIIYQSFLKWNNKMWGLYQEIEDTFYSSTDDNVISWPKHPYSDRKPWNVHAQVPPHLIKYMNQSFADFIRQDRLPRLLEEWIRLSMEPETAIEWDQIPALDGIDEFRIFLQNRNTQQFGENNYHIHGGNAQLITGLLKNISPSNIRTGCTVKTIETEDASVSPNDHDSILITYLEKDYKNDMRNVKTVRTSKCVCTIPNWDLKNIRFQPPLPIEKNLAKDTMKAGSYIKIHVRLKPDARKLWQHIPHCDTLFTLLTDTVLGAIYDSSSSPSSPEDNINLTILLHGKTSKDLVYLGDASIEEFVVTRLSNLFPNIQSYIITIEIFTFPNAVAYWPLEWKRSRFDSYAQKLRQPTNGVYIAGDTTFGSHSEGAGLSAQYIVNDLYKYFNIF